jgi:cytochrome c
MKIRTQIFTVLCAASFAAALTAAVAADPKAPDLAATGERILSEKCAQCHALGKTATSPLAAAPPFRSLAAKYPVAHLAEALAEGITTGHPDMPEFVFSTDEIAAILAYIEDISEPPAAK